MRQLMGQQLSALLAAWIVLTFRKNNVATIRVGTGTDGLRRLRRLCISMHPHPAEIIPEALPHVLLYHRLQWSTGTGKGLV
jgi:hypothetical protein